MPEVQSEWADGGNLRATIDALPRAIIVADLEGTILVWNRLAEALYGWRREEVLGRSILDVVVPAAGRDEGAAIMEQVSRGEVWEGDVDVTHRDGRTLRVWVTDSPIHDASGRVVAIVGASEDVQTRRRVEQMTAELSERLQLALDAGGLGTFQWDVASGKTWWDARVHELFGLEPGTFEGTFDAWTALLHPDDRDEVLATVEQAVATRSHFMIDHRVVWPDGSVHWLHGAGHITIGPDGEPTGAIGVTADITEQHEVHQELQRLTLEALEAADRARAGAERLAFLGRINDALAASRDRRSVMRAVVDTAVPRLGDWCSIHVLPTPDALVPDIEIAHVDPGMVAYARELLERFPYDPAADRGAARAIRTGRSELREEDALGIDLEAVPPEARDILERLGLRSAITVPLIKKGRILGAIQLVMSDSGRRYGPEDLALAEAAAARIASSLENQRLSHEQRHIAQTLQASLLPQAIPEVPGLDIAVRYWAKGEGVEVGGDFYDVFEIEAGRWAFVLGDVCGAGPQAAATAGLIRHTIAAAAWHGDEPERVLESLNRTMRNRDAGPFCTVLYGTLEATPSGPELTVVCGGHPLPVLASSTDDAALFGTPGTLIGALESIDVTATRRTLEPGDVLVGYTDGATDLRPPHALTDVDMTRIVGDVVARSRSAEDVADGIHRELHQIVPIEKRNDDIALLVLQATGPVSPGR